jgi:hypothetical protein
VVPDPQLRASYYDAVRRRRHRGARGRPRLGARAGLTPQTGAASSARRDRTPRMGAAPSAAAAAVTRRTDGQLELWGTVGPALRKPQATRRKGGVVQAMQATQAARRATQAAP